MPGIDGNNELTAVFTRQNMSAPASAMVNLKLEGVRPDFAKYVRHNYEGRNYIGHNDIGQSYIGKYASARAHARARARNTCTCAHVSGVTSELSPNWKKSEPELKKIPSLN